MDMGNEIRRDTCPQKYTKKGSFIKDSLPIIISLLVVAFFSGNLFVGSGMNTVLVVVIEIIIVLALYGVFYVFLGKMKKRQAETYISICEKGICGICPLNGYKNKSFTLYYNEIARVNVKGERLFVYSPKGNVSLTLNDAAGSAALITGFLQNR